MNEFLAILSIALATISYIPYIIKMRSGKTKPHIFSWIIWALLMGIAFFAQLSAGAGTGAWVMGYSVLGSLVVCLYALKKGEKNITKSDKIAFFTALMSIPLWYLTSNALYAVILVTIIHIVGFYPTIRKSYYKPHEEQMLMYTISSIKFFVALFALQEFNLTSSLYPASLVIINALFVVMVYHRRKIIGKS